MSVRSIDKLAATDLVWRTMETKLFKDDHDYQTIVLTIATLLAENRVVAATCNHGRFCFWSWLPREKVCG